MSRHVKPAIATVVIVIAALVVTAVLVRRFEARLAFFPFPGEDVTPQRFGLDYTPLTIETEDGERLRAWHLPHADAVAQVLYFHPNGGNLSVWADVLAGLVQHGYEVIAVDYRGFGLSTGTPSEGGLYRDVDATIAYVDATLRRDELPLIYWGRSLGAAMAAYAANRRAPDGVVLESGFSSARALFEGSPVMWALTYVGTYRFATAELMEPVTAPTLVLHGDADSVVPYAAGQKLFDSLRGPKRFVTIERGNHNDRSPPDAEAYWRAVAEFVQSISASSGGSRQ